MRPLSTEATPYPNTRIQCAWRSTISDTINREIYHRKSETFTRTTHTAADNKVPTLKITVVNKHSGIYFYPLNNAKKKKKYDLKNKELL